jgi:ribonuclease HII
VTEGTVLRRLVKFDRQYFDQEGVCLVAGVDEVGRGALAGPVVAGAVLIDCDCRIAGVNDSKQVDAGRREALYGEILKRARAVAIGWASAEEIDRINIYQATKLASCRALSALQLKPDVVLTDALRLEGLDVRVEPLGKGDTRSQAIAAASIVAKVTRDRWMRQLDAEYPGYGFAAHKGYAVELHLKALRERNASTIHRHSFRGVDWFEEEYQASLTYQRTVAELRQGLWQAAEVE